VLSPEPDELEKIFAKPDGPNFLFLRHTGPQIYFDNIFVVVFLANFRSIIMAENFRTN
jgi:hypothetical protein